MSLINSNTYIEPVSGTSLNNARLQFNDSMRSILTNFRSAATPTGVNVKASGATIGEQDGMLYRSTTTNALYISDSDQVKSSPVGGNFTRVGIGNRVENGIAALAANAESYEIGELVATVSEDGVLGANARLYLCTSNALTNGSASGFLDVGEPQGYSVGTNDNVTFSGQSVSAIRFLATTTIGVGTTSPVIQLDQLGDSLMHRIRSTTSTSAYARYQGTSGIMAVGIIGGLGYVGTTDASPLRLLTDSSEAMRIDSTGRVGIGTTTPSYPLHVQTVADTSIAAISSTTGTSTIRLGDTDNASAGRIGYDNSINSMILYTGGQERANVNSSGLQVTGDVEATDFNSTSDARLKQNITPIISALDKTLSMEGVYYNLIGSDKKEIGVIAQNIEAIVPEVVHTNNNDIKSVSYSRLSALLIEAIKEQNKTISTLSKKIDELEKSINN